MNWNNVNRKEIILRKEHVEPLLSQTSNISEYTSYPDKTYDKDNINGSDSDFYKWAFNII